MDVLDPTTMKDAANCDTQCDMLNFVNHQISERKWHFLGQPRSVYGSVSLNLLQTSISLCGWWSQQCVHLSLNYCQTFDIMLR